MNSRANDAKSANDAGTSNSDVGLTGNVVKVEPLAVLPLYDSLGAQDEAVGLLVVQCRQDALKLLCGKLLGGLGTAADKDLVGMMMVMVVSVLVIVMMAGAVGIVAFLIVVMMVMLVIVVMMMLMVMLVIVLVMMVAAAIGIIALLIVVMMVLMLVIMMMLMVVLMVMIVVMMMMAAAIGIIALLIVMMVMVVMLRLVGKTLQLLLDGVATLHGSQKLFAVQLIPRGGNDGSGGVMLTQKRNRLGDLGIVGALGMRENDTAGVLNLIVEELAKVLHIHLAFLDVGNRGKAVEENLLGVNSLHRLDDVGELANARGLDEDAIGMVLLQNLAESLSKVAYQRAADASAVHFGHLNAGVLHKAAVNADLTKLVLNENQLFAGIGFVQQLFDERGLTRTQKARENINLCHNNHPFFKIFTLYYISILGKCQCFCAKKPKISAKN